MYEQDGVQLIYNPERNEHIDQYNLYHLQHAHVKDNKGISNWNEFEKEEIERRLSQLRPKESHANKKKSDFWQQLNDIDTGTALKSYHQNHDVWGEHYITKDSEGRNYAVFRDENGNQFDVYKRRTAAMKMKTETFTMNQNEFAFPCKL